MFREGNVTKEEGSERCSIADFEDRGRGPYDKECRWPPDAGKGKEIDAVLEPLEKIQIC